MATLHDNQTATPRRDENTTQHTPGPWEVRRWDLSSPDIEAKHKDGKCLVATAWTWSGKCHRVSLAEARANAHLIAAAPELLEYLKAAREFLDGLNISRHAPICTAIDSLVAKAEGRQ